MTTHPESDLLERFARGRDATQETFNDLLKHSGQRHWFTERLAAPSGGAPDGVKIRCRLVPGGPSN